METVKETKEFKIVKKRSGRFGIRQKDGKWIGGDKKTEILVAEGLIKLSTSKKPVEEPAAAAETPAAEEAKSE